MRIDVAKLDVALAHKEASQQCPFCTRRDWITDETPAGVVPIDPNTHEAAAAGAPAAIMVCKHCGFIRLHALDIVFDGE
jgi:hypothetical protein